MFAAKDRKQQPSTFASASKTRDKHPSDLQRTGQPLDSLQMLQRSLGNHYLQALSQTAVQPDGLFIQRACACGGSCASCRQREDGRRMLLQPKLVVGAPNDVYEQEADRVAEQVMRMPEPKIQRLCPECEEELQRQPMEEEEKKEEEEETLQTKPLAESITPLIQRQTEPTEEEEKKKEEEETLQTKTASDEPPTVSSSLQNRIAALRGGGQLLPQSERNFFEPRFGADFSQVRIHADTQAAETARAVNARAFTVGRDVVFGAGQYQPSVSEVRQLLAHELTHVVQQNRTGPLRQALREEMFLEEPRSLRQTLYPNLLSPFEIEKEIKLIQQWLSKHPKDRDLLIGALELLEGHKEKLKTKASAPGGKVCLTFDDGPGKGTGDVLSALGNTVPATFFVIGNQIENNQDLVKEMIKKSNIQIGNHTFSHELVSGQAPSAKNYRERFKDLTTPEQKEDFKQWFAETSKTLEALGIKPKLARLPGGGIRSRKPPEPQEKKYKSKEEYDREFKNYNKNLKIYEENKNLQKSMIALLEDKKYGLGLKHVMWDSEFTTYETGGFTHVKYPEDWRENQQGGWQGVTKVRCEHEDFPKGVILFHDSHWAGKKDRLDKLLKKLGEKCSFGQLNDQGNCE